jgi:hypothetical protein
VRHRVAVVVTRPAAGRSNLRWLCAKLGENQRSRALDDVGGSHHDDIAKHLVADTTVAARGVGVSGAWVAEPVDDQGRGGVGEWPAAQQRLVGICQDHSLGVGVALDLFRNFSACSIRQRRASAARATELVEVHGPATLGALHPLDHRLIARLPLEADGCGPDLEHVLQGSEVPWCRRRPPRLG